MSDAVATHARRRLLRAIVTIGLGFAAPSVGALAALSLFGLVHPLAGLVAALLICGGCVLIARRQARRLAVATAALNRLGDGDMDETGLSEDGLFGPLDLAIQRVRRQQIASADRQNRREAAERAILDALPDPLLLLGAERTIRRANAAARAEFGDDVTFIKATIADRDGRRCYRSDDMALKVKVTGEGIATVPAELSTQGGLARFAVRSKVEPGQIIVETITENISHKATAKINSILPSG